MTRWITRHERDPLWEAAADALGGIDDLLRWPRGLAPNYGGNVAAGYLRQRLADALWLLDDLGWQRDDPRERFYLSLPEDRLRRFLGWIAAQSRGYAVDDLIPWHREQWTPSTRLTPEEFADAQREAAAQLETELEIYAAATAVLDETEA